MGELYSDLEAAKNADLITMPDGIKGTRCDNCMYFKNNYCYHKAVDQRVLGNWDCRYWNAPGTKRPWKGQNEWQKVQLITVKDNVTDESKENKMEINITSDMTYEGTKATTDGKAGKGELEYLSFTVSKRHAMPDNHGVEGQHYYDVDMTAVYCDEAEDGTKSRHQYNWHNQNPVVEDHQQVYDPNAVVADVVKKMMGQKGIL